MQQVRYGMTEGGGARTSVSFHFITTLDVVSDPVLIEFIFRFPINSEF